MELIFNPGGEFWWNPEGPVSQIHSPHLHIAAPGIFSDFLRSVQMLKREWGMGSHRTYSIPGKTAALVPEFAVEDLPSAELQPRFPRLQWWTSPWAEHSDDDDDDDSSRGSFFHLPYISFHCFFHYYLVILTHHLLLWWYVRCGKPAFLFVTDLN